MNSLNIIPNANIKLPKLFGERAFPHKFFFHSIFDHHPLFSNSFCLND